jgi:hypothetical protein
MYKYYLGVLAQGAQPEGSLERQDYDKLRASLAGDTLAARLYGKWLTAFLDWIERFFGDVGMADRTLFPQAFGLKKPASLWTAPAFDRCLLLALIYPIATIFVIWAISGHVGPAEAALGLRNRPDGAEAWWRWQSDFRALLSAAPRKRRRGCAGSFGLLSVALPPPLSMSLAVFLSVSSFARPLALLLTVVTVA